MKNFWDGIRDSNTWFLFWQRLKTWCCTKGNWRVFGRFILSLLTEMCFCSLLVFVLSRANHILDLSLYWRHWDENIINLLIWLRVRHKTKQRVQNKCSIYNFHAFFSLFVLKPTPLFLAAAGTGQMTFLDQCLFFCLFWNIFLNWWSQFDLTFSILKELPSKMKDWKKQHLSGCYDGNEG